MLEGRPREGRQPIKVKRIVADIRMRLPDSELMAKYGLSSEELRRVLQVLTKAGAIRQAELDERGARFDDPMNRNATRGVPRHYMRIAPSILDLDDPANKGLLTDLSDSGFRVRGILARVGEERRFRILANAVPDVGDVSVRATCKWFNDNPNERNLCEAGFHIDRVTEEGLKRIKGLIKVLSLGDRNVGRSHPHRIDVIGE
jgi:hypothetical protein